MTVTYELPSYSVLARAFLLVYIYIISRNVISGDGSSMMVTATVRWMGVPEAEARMVEVMYERTKGRVVDGSGLLEEFLSVNIRLRQRSALRPFLFIMVMELISRKISTKDVLRKMMYASDLAIMAESKQELQEVMEEWKGVLKNHGLRMSWEKTEVIWVGHQREELNIRLGGKQIKQVDDVVHLGGMVTEDGHSEVEVRHRIQTGANVCRKVEGVMLDRQHSKTLKGKVLRACITPACLYGLETVALTEQHYTGMPAWSGDGGADRTTLHRHACMVWRRWR